jgi:hypothetical protein
MCAELCLFSRSLKMQAAVQRAPRDKSMIFRPSADTSSRRRLRLLSCNRSVGGLLLAVLAKSIAKLRSNKKQANTPVADPSQVCCSRYVESLVTARASRVARLSEARTQELRRPCPLFAERAQESDQQTALGGTWQCPVLWIADDRSDMAISTANDPNRS